MQEFISTVAAGLRLTLANATTVQAVAGTNDDQVGIGIDGLWRYNSATATGAASGAAGTKDIYVVASANSFSASPSPDTDLTDYSWGIQVVTSGGSPSGTHNGNAIVASRKIGELEWDGAAITSVRQNVGAMDVTLPSTPTAMRANMTPIRAVGVTGQTAPLITARPTLAGTDVFSVAADGTIVSSGGLTAQGNVRLGDADTDTLGFFSVAGAARAAAGADIKDALTAYGLLQGTSASPLDLDGGALSAGALTATGNVRLGDADTDTVGFFSVAGSARAVAGADLKDALTAYGLLQGTTASPLNLDGGALTAGAINGTGGTLDPGSGTAAATLNLTGRNAGAAQSGYVQTATDGTLYLNAAGGSGVVGRVGGTDRLVISTTGITIPTGATYQINGVQIAAANLSNGTTGSGSVVLAASPTLTGTPLAPTAAVDTNTTQVATTAYVVGQGYLKSATAGTTYQPLDATLTALAAYNTNGLLTQTAADTFTGRTITGTAGQISVANGSGVAGNPTLSLPATITQLETFSAGIATSTAAGTVAISVQGGGTSPWEIVPVAASPNSVRIRFGDGTGWSMQIAPQFGANANLAALRIYDSGKLGWAVPTTGVEDTNLYRSAADTLATDDSLVVANTGNFALAHVILGDSTNGALELGKQGNDPGAQAPYIDWHFASAGAFTGQDYNIRLQNDAANQIAFKFVDGTQARLTSGNVFAKSGGSDQVVAGSAGPGGAAGVAFGSSQDTNLYRSAADTLKTDDKLIVAPSVADGADLVQVVGVPGASAGLQVERAGNNADLVMRSTVDGLRTARLSGTGMLSFGSTGDTNLYRFSADLLATDDALLLAAVPGGSGARGIGVRVSGDTQDRLTIAGSGAMSWGPGGVTAPDTNLYRGGADTLRTDDQMQAIGGAAQIGFSYVPATAVGSALAVYVGAEANPRYYINVTGTHQWGAGGASAVDTNLYRNGANTLKTDGYLQVGASSLSNAGLTINSQQGIVVPNSGGTGYGLVTFKRSTDTTNRFTILDGGPGGEPGAVLQWGPGGAAALDTNLYRSAADVLKTDDNFSVGPITSGNPGGGGSSGVWIDPVGYVITVVRPGDSAAFHTSLTSDTIVRFVITAGGIHRWGPGGAGAADTNLYRSALGVLKTDNSLHVAADFRHLGSNLGFFNVAAAARAAARTMSNWTLGSNALRSIDRNNFTLQNLFDYVMTMTSDLQSYGLFA